MNPTAKLKVHLPTIHRACVRRAYQVSTTSCRASTASRSGPPGRRAPGSGSGELIASTIRDRYQLSIIRLVVVLHLFNKKPLDALHKKAAVRSAVRLCTAQVTLTRSKGHSSSSRSAASARSSSSASRISSMHPCVWKRGVRVRVRVWVKG